MDLLGLFKQFIKEEDLFHPEEPLLVAVSGGVDSMVLSELCRRASLRFVIAHCNFHLRDEESNGDEAFVRQWGAVWQVEVMVKHFDTREYAAEKKLSIQAAARELRYDWFNAILNDGIGNSIANQTGLFKTPSLILTAHHADDNIETVLMSFFKGTGIAGLRGMLPMQGNIVRPLLFARKSAIVDFANAHNLAYREDSSNASDEYSRNFLRHRLMPVVQQVYPRSEENLIKNLTRFREVEELYRQAIHHHKKNLLEPRAGEIHIPILKLKKTTPLKSVLYEIIKEYGFSPNQVGEVIDLMESESGKFVQSASWRIIKDRRWLIVSPKKNEAANTIVVEKNDSSVPFENGFLHLRHLARDKHQLNADATIAALDAGRITFPLILRLRKQGDYFYPLGMQKKKKLNRFLTDLKLSKTEKENTWVLEMNKSILWVINRRIDDRFKVTEKTRQVFQITFTPNDSKQHPGRL